MVSDGRMKIIAGALEADGIEVLACKSQSDMEEMQRRAGEWDVLLLPVRGIDRDGYAVVGEVRFPMENVMRELSRDAIVITGLQTDYLKKCSRSGRRILCYFEDEAVHKQNAALTAEGILYLMLKETTKSIFSQTVDLVGFGYVGKAAHELLKKMEISHRIVDKLPQMYTDGSQIIDMESWQNMEPAGIIINSVPAEIANMQTACSWPENTVFLDIASGAVGACEELKKVIHYVAAPPLPGLIAEESAGLMLAEYVRRQLALAE